MRQSQPARTPKSPSAQLLPILLLTACVLTSHANDSTETATIRENKIIATYLVNFLLFITHAQPITHEFFTIAIVGNDPFGNGFDSVEGQTLDKSNRKLRIVRLARYDQTAATTLRNADLVFIATPDAQQTREVLSALHGYPIITVSTADQFLEAGGMVRLVQLDKQIRWELNSATLKDAGLSASAQLCRSAVRVLDKPIGIQ